MFHYRIGWFYFFLMLENLIILYKNIFVTTPRPYFFIGFDQQKSVQEGIGLHY